MNEVYFVKGGTPKSAGSNRMKELSTDFDRYEYHDETVEEFSLILKSGEFSDLVGFFDRCEEFNVNLVGSRDFVYRSEKMRLLVNLILDGDSNVCRFVPRTLGFRKAAKSYAGLGG